MKKKLGIYGVESRIGSGGVGYVVVPDETGRDQYIEECYRTNTITMNGGVGCGYISRVSVDVSVMQNVEFPTDKENRGSMVVWIQDAITKLPVVVALIRKQSNYYKMAERQYRLSRGTQTQNVDVFIDGNTSTLQINVLGNEEQPSKLDIKLSSTNKDSEFTLNCDNKMTLVVEKELEIIANNKTILRVTEEGEDKTTLMYEKGVGLSYNDEFGNIITCKEGKVNIVSESIHHNEGEEPMVLGDTLATILDDILKAIQQITVITPVGTSSVPVNIASFASIQAKLDTIKSQISKLD